MNLTPTRQENRNLKAINQANHDISIAILGAGISGLSLARALKKKGYHNVVLFEREGEVGGKVQTITYGNHVYELGALVANHDFKWTMDNAKRYAEHLTKTEDACLVDEDGTIFTYREFIKQKVGLLNFVASAAKFWEVVHHHPELHKPGFATSGIDLYAPMDEFGKKANISTALEAIRPFLIGCGYGFYESTPAMYLMKLAPWVLKQPFSNLLSFGQLKTWSTFDQGWQDLLRRMSQDIDVRLHTEVTQVRRIKADSPTTIEISTHQDVHRFDRLMIAAPLDAALSYLDASPREKDLFERIRYVRYVSTIVEGDNLFTVHFLPHTTPDKIGHINCIVREHEDDPLFQIYQMLGNGMTCDDALRFAEEDVRLLDGRVVKVIAQKEWAYFPHVSSADLRDGYYQTLESIQGNKNTYYCGSLFNFETVEHNAVYAEDLVQRFF